MNGPSLRIRAGQVLGLAFLGWLGPLDAAEPHRGDVDADGGLNITDAIGILDFLFLSGTAPYCQPVADVNDDGGVDISDAVRLLNHLFNGDGAPPALSEEEVGECGGNNLPPTLPERPLYRAYPGQLVEFALGAVDPEGDLLRYEAPGAPAGLVLDSHTGVLSWTPAGSDVGRLEVTYAVSDGRPPNRVEGVLVFEVLPFDPCVLPRCDPALGCELEPVDDLATECCGEPGTRVPDPEAACPEGAVLHLGRNSTVAPTIGRIQNCDGLRITPLAQGGSGVHLNLEARCVDSSWFVTVRARLETATAVLVSGRVDRFINDRDDGYQEARSMGFFADGVFSEGDEAHLTVSLTDSTGFKLERRVRVVLTEDRLEDLP